MESWKTVAQTGMGFVMRVVPADFYGTMGVGIKGGG